ncbi:MAG: hypothetical protein HY912_07690 [Desulfomonile tiedjei]|uniref:Uncharacterized protein n=1 Tax=Desulfomonile tiedjei TaxID=2358 RepID=A0A9D6Z314_9BACT|nr:hypothetical protein [Desulfomonile tiedjei]
MEHQEEICNKIVSIIRDSSDSGHLIRADEILSELKGQGLLDSECLEEEAYLKTMLKQALKENRDLKEILGPNGGSHYYSVRSLSETYARILIWKLEAPLCMIAEIVRENSKLYPRPIPISSFSEPPFDLTQESILECLEAMGEDKEYQDIARTVTSVGKAFLYSSRHIDPDHAAMLAEWLDVGQANSP